MSGVCAIVVAAGRGSRSGAPVNKVLMPLMGRPLLAWSLEAFDRSPQVNQLVLVAADQEQAQMQALTASLRLPCKVVCGGETRQISVYRGLAAAKGAEIALIHDGARPLVSPELIDACVRQVRQKGSAVAGMPVKDTIKRTNGERMVLNTPPRDNLWQVQTPQAFFYRQIFEAHQAAESQGISATDDASLVEAMGQRVYMLPGGYENIKVTTPEDFLLAEALLTRRVGARRAVPRTGLGYDAHRLAEGRALVLGGVTIPWERGLLGHSDADVLTHAVMDAILGASSLGDIGRHFPDTDPAYAGASSVALLEQVRAKVEAQGWRVVHVDATIQAQAPKLAPHIEGMTRNLAAALALTMDAVSIKATTTEGMGFAGRGEGMACQAVATLVGQEA